VRDDAVSCEGGRLLRRDFISLLGGAAASWPLAVHAQERVRRVGVLMHAAADDADARARLAQFLQGLQEAGWAVGRNIRIDTRWSGGDIARLRRDAAELIALGPDAVLAGVGATVPVLLQASHTVPIVFAQAIDPVGNDYVDGMAHPGRNATGFIQFEYSLAGKWMELLKEVAPSVTHVGILREPGNAAIGQWAIIQSIAQSMGVELKPIDLSQGPGPIERSVATLARSPNAGMIVVVSATSLIHRELIIALAARHRLPTVYAFHFFVTAGGLLSYSVDINLNYRRAANYVDRIL
jgi:putative tryptophan/tyrosine transport system substrate-binding protein